MTFKIIVKTILLQTNTVEITLHFTPLHNYLKILLIILTKSRYHKVNPIYV